MTDKQEILRHIRRIAAANGGVPPGRRRLTSETGIRDYDWEGFYWVRWSDALQEAGFEPNTMCQPHADEFLMESLISVLRERGHFPTRHELRYRAVREPNFLAVHHRQANLTGRAVGAAAVHGV